MRGAAVQLFTERVSYDHLRRIARKGGFPLSRNFHVHPHVDSRRVNEIEAMFFCIYREIEAMYELSGVSRSTFTFTCDLSYIVTNLFTHLKISGNPP